MAMINSIILLIFFFLNILLSLFIYIKAGRRKDSLFFSLAIFATGLWALAIAISTIVNTSQAVLLWTRLAFFGPSLIIFLLVNFVLLKLLFYNTTSLKKDNTIVNIIENILIIQPMA